MLMSFSAPLRTQTRDAASVKACARACVEYVFWRVFKDKGVNELCNILHMMIILLNDPALCDLMD